MVKIAPTSVPPVCKIMDYSKYKYEQNKKEKEMKRNQKTIEVKEVWLSMTIDIGDLNTKANITRKFLKDGNKVKATIRMRGRQQAYASQGVEVMKKFAEILADVAKIDKQCNKNHKLGKKTTKRTRNLRSTAYVDETKANTIKHMLPY